jgi:hypothetical protein
MMIGTETHDSFVLVNETQYMALMIVLAISATLSTFGSASLLFLVRARSSVFEQLMFGISVADLISTISTALQPYLLPKYTLLPFAHGNASTCQLQGFLLYAFLASSLYSVILSYYFWASLLQVPRAPVSLPLWIHLSPWAAMGVLGTPAICVDSIYPSLVLGICQADCPIDPVTWECDDASTLSITLALISAAVPMVCSVVGIVILVKIYLHVQNQEKRNEQYNIAQSFEPSSATRSRRTKRMHYVMMQAICYSLAFLNSFVAIGVANTGKRIFHDWLGLQNPWLFFFVELYAYAMFPLQGFLNWMVFVRPRVIRWKEKFPDMSYFWCLRQTIMGQQLPAVSTRTMELQMTPEVSVQDQWSAR